MMCRLKYSNIGTDEIKLIKPSDAVTGGKEKHEQGHAAERLFEQVANHAYLPSFCFPNPKHPKTNKEICDMLVVCGSRALIWQAKNIKKHTSGSFKEGEV